MPLLRIQTNVELPPERRSTVLREASRAVAAMLGKPERYVMVTLEPRPDMLFAGDDAPLAYLELKSIGLAEGATAACSRSLCELIREQFGVSPERVYIELTAVPRAFWGWDGGTF